MDSTKKGEAEYSPEALREKYRIEREKRLRPDGDTQYIDPAEVFADFDKDPYVEPGFTRPAVDEAIDVLIVGGGFGGMLAAVRLRQRGVHSFRIVEKGGDFGGTWYWNRYPGAACDVESYIYMPLLEETGYIPTEKYAKATEIFAHCQRIGRRFDLYPTALFQTEVEQMDWDEAAKRWTVTTSRGDRLAARFVIIAGGILHKAKLPGIPGIETFAGHSFHTSRWDYAYTGGSPDNPLMERLADKRVGIIGTGATAVQAIPHLGAAARQLYVFQRTPSSVGPRDNRPTDEAWAKSLKPGWQRERMLNFTATAAPTSSTSPSCAAPRPRRRRRRSVSAPMTARWRRSARGSPRSCGTRRRPRRSSPITTSSASGPASTTNTWRRSTARTCSSSTLTGEAWSGSRRPAWSCEARSIRSTA